MSEWFCMWPVFINCLKRFYGSSVSYIFHACLSWHLSGEETSCFFFPNSLQACMSWVHLIDQDTMRIHSTQLEHRCLSSTVIIAFLKKMIGWTLYLRHAVKHWFQRERCWCYWAFFLFKTCRHVWVVNSLSQILESCRNSSKVQIPPFFSPA